MKNCATPMNMSHRQSLISRQSCWKHLKKLMKKDLIEKLKQKISLILWIKHLKILNFRIFLSFLTKTLPNSLFMKKI